MDKIKKLIETAQTHLDADESARLSHANGLELLIALKSAAKRSERMEKALRPFDNVAVLFSDRVEDDRPVTVTLGACRAARRALSEEPQ